MVPYKFIIFCCINLVRCVSTTSKSWINNDGTAQMANDSMVLDMLKYILHKIENISVVQEQGNQQFIYLNKTIIDLKEQIVDSKDQIIGLKVQIIDSKEQIIGLKEQIVDLKVQITSVNETVKSGFNFIHDVGAERAAILDSVTYGHHDNVSGNHATSHSVYYNGTVFFVGVKHHSHYNLTRDSNATSIICKFIDVQLIPGCPSKNKSLDITHSVSLRAGDSATTFGYIYEYGEFKTRVWTGTLAGRFGHQNDDVSLYNPNEYMFQGVAQIDGMSGGPSINGNGYTGIVHANQRFHTYNVSMALVVPVRLILDCIEANADKFAMFPKMVDTIL